MRKFALWLCSGIALMATQAWAEVGEARLGQQFGAVDRPAMVMESRQLVERHLAAAGLGNVKVGWVKLGGLPRVNDAMSQAACIFACQEASSAGTPGRCPSPHPPIAGLAAPAMRRLMTEAVGRTKYLNEAPSPVRPFA
jgi:hypothetical protein